MIGIFFVIIARTRRLNNNSMEISSKFLKVSSQIELKDDLQFQKSYRVILDGEVVKKEIFDENDGTFKVVFKYKPTSIEIE